MNPKWQKGDVTLYLGDCREILPTLGKVDAVITDPPWRASNGSRVNRRPGDGMGVAPSRLSTSLEYGSIGFFDVEIIKQLPCVSRADVLVLCGYMELQEVIASIGKLRGVMVWHNSRPTPIPGAIAARDIAFIVWGGNATLAGKNGYRWQSCVLRHQSPQGGCFATERILNDDGSTAHPAQEPLSLFADLVRPCGETILDPYLGSGTTGVAAVRLGRKFIGIEIEPKYFEIAQRRIEAAMEETSLLDYAQAQAEQLTIQEDSACIS